MIEFGNKHTSIASANPNRMYFAVLALALLFYVFSCAPGALWQDSGVIQYRVLHNDIEGGMGLALSHPLFYIIAIAVKYVPLGNFLYRVNLVSAIAAALAVGNIFLFVRLLTARNFAAVIAAITLAVSHTFWRHGSIIETYTLYTALFTTELILLLLYIKSSRVKYLYWLGFISGLSIATHMLGSLALLCYGIFFVYLLAKKKIFVKDFLIIVLVWILGALPYEFLIIKNIAASGDFLGTLASAAFGNGWQGDVLNTALSARIIKENILFIGLNFPTPNILLFFAGVWVLFRDSRAKAIRNILLALTLLFFIFAFRYTIADRYAFFIPFYCMVSIFIGYGVGFLQSAAKRRILAYLILAFSVLPVLIYWFLPSVVKSRGISLGISRTIPYRDEYNFFLQPWKDGYHGADRFSTEALESVEKNAVIYADGTTAYALLLTREIENKRTDVSVVSNHATINNIGEYGSEAIANLISERAVYVVSPRPGYCPEFLLERYDFVKAGVLHRVVEKH
ncbi:MAG: DUF2723 domain-containing protein [Planctomycetes bacterium]|nr:DUF2723 domain-containing protein [Planctomycetota bacterium]